MRWFMRAHYALASRFILPMFYAAHVVSFAQRGQS